MPLGSAAGASPVTLGSVRIDEVDEFASSLAGVRRTGHPGQRKWLLEGRLVAREDMAGSLIIRVDFAERERLLERHPETFGVPPRCEKHMKVQADLDGDAAAIKDAIRLAWRLQLER
jgi:hypothetical protein